MNLSVRKFSLLLLAIATASSNAATITCPSVEQIKSARFMRATPYDVQSNVWELISLPFNHDGVLWGVSFGVVLPQVRNPDDALRIGRNKFNEVRISIEKPSSDPIPGFLFCDYTHSGTEYWIQASEPTHN